MAEVLFYLLAAGAVVFGVGVVAARMPIFSVLNLLGTFFCVAGVYLLTGFQFLAVTQLLVYAGAIMVLFLFVIMLLNLHDESLGGTLMSLTSLPPRTLALASATAGVFVLTLIFASGVGPPPGSAVLAAARIDEGLDQLVPLAEVLFTRYALPFEAASLLLLATMVGVIMLAKRDRPRAKGDTSASWPWTPAVDDGAEPVQQAETAPALEPGRSRKTHEGTAARPPADKPGERAGSVQ
ncbi:MAG: NADH-quinone oxidoreductase subunit J [Planctomycetota bacterium]